MCAVRIERQHAIVHSALGRDAAVRGTQFVYQGVGVHVVEAVARRHIGSLVVKDRGQVRVLAVEVQDVGSEVALLQQIGAARQVVHPRPGLLRPGFIAGEPLPEGAKAQSRSLADQRLMHRP